MKFALILSALLLGHAVGQNIVEVAVSLPSTFSTLVDLVVTAGLDEALSTTQDLTVFAPTDDAFGKLHPPSVNLLKTEQWRPHLQNLLLQHVLPVEVPSTAITDGLTAAALNGEEVKLNLPMGGGVVVDDTSSVVQADVEADNGIVHVVDTVLFPEWVSSNIVDRAVADPELTVLTKLVTGLHLTNALSFHGPFTVFAPTDEAILEGIKALGIEDGFIDAHTAATLVTYHIVYGIYSAEDITDGLQLMTAQGEEIQFSFDSGSPQVNGQNIVATNVLANNGIVHKIDGLLVPPSVTETPEDPEPQTVVDVAVANEDTFSLLVDFVVTANLVDPLATTQGITVFAPTNDAFAALGDAAPDVVANLMTTEWSTHLQDVLLYHVLPVEVPSSAVTDGLTATTLNGEDLSFTVGDGIFVNSGSEVIVPDVGASNGVIHAIDNVLLPSWVSSSIVDRAVGSPLLTTLVSLVVQAGLTDTLSGPGPFTVFAPTDDAFFEFLGDDANMELMDADLITSILTYHVVPGIYSASEIANGLELTTVQGEELTFSVMGNTAMVNGEGIVATDILANNGIVHVIDGVLVPTSITPDAIAPVEPQNVAEVAVSMSDTFSTLVDFVVTANLVDPLATTQGITVFAPTNDAFAALASAAPDVVANLLTAEWSTHLQDVLLYHVLPVEVPSSAVTDGLSGTALNGEVLSFDVNNDGIFVNSGSEVIVADVDASNGVIHAIDNVLLPSWVSSSIVNRAVESPLLTTLVDLVIEAELAGTLSGPGPFTVFAPTNEAFLQFLGDDPDPLDIGLVTSILKYHVVPGIYSASEITNGLELTTVQGEDLTFSLMGNTAMVNGEGIVATDILANNGIVHVIDGVLLPFEALTAVSMEYGVGGRGNDSTLSQMGSEQSSASGYRTSIAAAATAAVVVGFGVVVGVVF